MPRPQPTNPPRDPRATSPGGPAAVSAAPKPAAPAARETTGPAGAPSPPQGALINRPPAAEPYAFWDDYFKTHDIDGTALLTNLVRLRRERQFRDIEAAILGFLRHDAKDPAPWLYEMLATAIQMNGGKPERVRDALEYAARQALKSPQVNDLTRVADLLAMHAMHDRAGQLLEKAAGRDPGDARPPRMLIALAVKTRDPARFADSAERLLSLGWPGFDEPLRAEVRKQAEELAAKLREDGRTAEAAELLAKLGPSEARDLLVRLTWSGDADLDLAVEEPLGAVARVATPRTVFGGAILNNGYGKHPEEIYACPRGFDGDYKIRIETIYNSEKDPARDLTLGIVTHEGTDRERTRTEKLAVDQTAPVVVRLEGGRRARVLPFQALPAPPESALAEGSTATRPPATAAPPPSAAGAADALRAPGSKPAARPRLPGTTAPRPRP